MNLSTKQKQTDRHREHTFGFQGESGWRRDGLGVWDKQMQMIIHKIDK